MLDIHSLQEKIISQALFAIIFRQQFAGTYDYQLSEASYGTVYACSYDDSKAFAVLVFRDAGNSNFSTKDYCTVELAPTAAKLTILCDLRQKEKLFFTSHATKNVWNVITQGIYNQ